MLCHASGYSRLQLSPVKDVLASPLAGATFQSTVAHVQFEPSLFVHLSAPHYFFLLVELLQGEGIHNQELP